jgi:hypothetical protein
MIFAIFGGATVKVRKEDNVMLSGVASLEGRVWSQSVSDTIDKVTENELRFLWK